MRNSREYAAVLSKLVRRIRREQGAVEEPELHDPQTELVLACLSFHAPEAKAKAALSKLNGSFVDINELRVCRENEVARMLGTGYPAARETAGLLITSLKALFEKQDTVSLDDLHAMGKRDAKAYLESLEGLPPYVVARVMLRGLGGHSFPLHDKMLEMLRDEEVIDPNADVADVQGFLERQIAAKDILKHYMLLREYADSYDGKKTATTKKVTRNSTTKKKTAAKKKTKTGAKKKTTTKKRKS